MNRMMTNRTRYLGEDSFQHGSDECLGVLLVNLGTPAAPTRSALRSYLREFLSDPRVVELPRWLWRLILHGVILNVRPAVSARAYRKIWTSAGSPLLDISQRQAQVLQRALAERYPGPLRVVLGMRYGQPAIHTALAELKSARARRLLVLPLYPQYSGSTTGSVFDAVSAALQRWRWVPATRFINCYHDEPGYLRALANSVSAHWREHGRGQQLLMSFHGVPKRYLLAGDPYFCQCHKTARLLAQRLQLADEQWQIVFQSRFGREEWLRPYCDDTLRGLPDRGVTAVDVVCPGFAADCLETLEEIDDQNRTLFLKSGGERFHYIPCLNEQPDHIALLTQLVADHAQGWPELTGRRKVDEQESRDTAMSRARALGADF